MSPAAVRIAELAAQGLTADQIAAEVGKTRNAVIGITYRNHIRLHGNDIKNRKFRATERKQGCPAPVKTTPPPRPHIRGTGCRYIAGAEKPYIYCDAPVSHAGSSWCAAHRAIVYTDARGYALEPKPGHWNGPL